MLHSLVLVYTVVGGCLKINLKEDLFSEFEGVTRFMVTWWNFTDVNPQSLRREKLPFIDRDHVERGREYQYLTS